MHARLEAEVAATLRMLLGALERSGLPYALFGALARAAWGRLRATTDVDVEVLCGPGEWESLRAGLLEAGLSLEAERTTDVTDPVPEHVVFRGPGDVRVDLLVAKTPFEVEAVGRRRRVSIGGMDIWIVSPEDLVVFKLVSARPQDVADIEDVLEARTEAGLPLDWDYIRRHAADWEILERLAPFETRWRRA